MTEPQVLATARDGSARYVYRGIEFKVRKDALGYSSGEIPIAGSTCGMAWVEGMPSTWGYNALPRLLRKVARRIDKDYAEMERDRALAPGAAEVVVSRFAADPDGDWHTLERDLDRAVRREDR